MSSFYLDIFLCCVIYIILLGIIFWRKPDRNDDNDIDNNDDGGLPIESDPILDLPPGICLPSDGPIMHEDQLDEAVA
jgi:hypothetical protein